MKTPALLATSLLALATFAQAAPTEINYQGVLTDQNGNPINGVRAMQLKIYDAPIGGTLLYSEDIGNVPVQDGIYSFSFGANGTSNALTTETIAIANGTVSTFQKVLTAPTVVAGSVTVTDGTYTWDQTNGSSNESDFSVAYSPNLRRVTVTYYNGAPAAGKTISATYRSPNAGLSGALGDIGNAWTELAMGGTAQNPRQKVMAVPFALYATSVGKPRLRSLLVDRFFKPGWNNITSFQSLPFQYSPVGGGSVGLSSLILPPLQSFPLDLTIPSKITKISSSVIDSAAEGTGWYYNANPNKCYGKLTITLYRKRAGQPDEVVAVLDSGGNSKPGETILSQSLNLPVEGEEVFWVDVWAPYDTNVNNQTSYIDGQLKVNWVKVEFEQLDLN